MSGEISIKLAGSMAYCTYVGFTGTVPYVKSVSGACFRATMMSGHLVEKNCTLSNFLAYQDVNI